MQRDDCRIPDFIICGAPRSGTTFLCEALQRHPDLYFAKPFIPEPKVLIIEKPEQEYFSAYNSFFSEAPAGKFLVEKTSGYFESAQCCDRIAKIVPKAKLLIMVREPVARAYSNYWRTRENCLENLSFEDAIAAEGLRKSPLPPDKTYARPNDYLIRGYYDVFAAKYYSVFERKQIGFFLYEEIKSNPGFLLKKIQQFLGIKEVSFDVLNPGIINALKEKVTPISKETEKTLRARMALSVKKFQNLTGLDISEWQYEFK